MSDVLGCQIAWLSFCVVRKRERETDRESERYRDMETEIERKTERVRDTETWRQR